MVKILKSGLVMALERAIEAQAKLEKKQGRKGDSPLIRSWTEARDALCVGGVVELVDSLEKERD